MMGSNATSRLQIDDVVCNRWVWPTIDTLNEDADNVSNDEVPEYSP